MDSTLETASPEQSTEPGELQRAGVVQALTTRQIDLIVDQLVAFIHTRNFLITVRGKSCDQSRESVDRSDERPIFYCNIYQFNE